jgi:hypothetical protein
MEFSEIVDRVHPVSVLEATGAENLLLPHLRWELEQVMTRVKPADLSAAEVAGLLAVLRPVHARIVVGPAGRPGLRIVGRGGEQPTPKLA